MIDIKETPLDVGSVIYMLSSDEDEQFEITELEMIDKFERSESTFYVFEDKESNVMSFKVSYENKLLAPMTFFTTVELFTDKTEAILSGNSIINAKIKKYNKDILNLAEKLGNLKSSLKKFS